MHTDSTVAPSDTADASLTERLIAVVEMLERIAADRRVLDQLSDEDRRRFHQAVADVYNPDSGARRRAARAEERERAAAKLDRIDAALHETGIRTLRRRPVFTTPNIFPPEGFEPRDIVGEQRDGEA